MRADAWTPASAGATKVGIQFFPDSSARRLESRPRRVARRAFSRQSVARMPAPLAVNGQPSTLNRLCFHVPLEVIQDRLPTVALLLDRMRRLAVESHSHVHAVRVRSKLHLGRTIAEGILDQLVLDDVRVRAREIETHATVLRLHPRREGTAHAQIHGRCRRMPVIGRGIPLLDVFRCRVRTPYFVDGCRNAGFNSDLQCVSPLSIIRGSIECPILRTATSLKKTSARTAHPVLFRNRCSILAQE